MLNVLETTKTAYKTPSSKAFTISVPNRSITFDNSDIDTEGIDLSEAIENERYLTFKGCIASVFRFRVAGIVTDLRGEYIEVTVQADNTEVIPYFKGYIDAQDNQTHEDIITEFTCYDALYKVGSRNMQSWIEGLTYPITIKNFRNSLFTALGITQESKTLVNDNQAIDESILGFIDNPSAVDLMRWICQVNAVYGQIGRDGQFKYRELTAISEGLYPSETTYPGETTYPSAENAGFAIQSQDYLSENFKYEPYETDLISKVVIFDSSGIAQGQAGSGSNVFAISDNPIAFSINMMSAASSILAKIDTVSYIPVVSMKCVGLPYVECGDIYISYTRLNAVRTYVLNRTLSGLQSLIDTYSSDADKDQPEYKPTAQTGINENRKSVLKIQADIVEMNELIAQRATIQQLNAVNANVQTLSAKEANFENATAQNFSAANGRIDTLTTRVATVESLDAQKATIQQLNTTNANVNNLTSRVANVESLDAQKATIQQLNSTNANVSNLSARVANVEQITAKAITTDNLSAQSINSNQVRASYVNGHLVTWQKISCIGSGNWGYLYQNNSTKEVVVRTQDSPPDPSWKRVGGFLNGIYSKGFYTIAQDNV